MYSRPRTAACPRDILDQLQIDLAYFRDVHHSESSASTGEATSHHLRDLTGAGGGILSTRIALVTSSHLTQHLKQYLPRVKNTMSATLYTYSTVGPTRPNWRYCYVDQ